MKTVNNTRRSGLKEAFSLLEIMIAVAIIGVFAAMVGPSLMKYLGRGKAASTKSQLANIKMAVQDYMNDVGHAPTKKEGGLDALIDKPRDQKVARNWDGPYLEGVDELPLDAWNNEFVYHTGKDIVSKKYRHFEIISTGESGELEEGANFDVGA